MGLSVLELCDAQPLPSPSPQPGGGNKLVVARRFTTVLIEAAHAFRSYAEQRRGVPARRDPPI